MELILNQKEVFW